LIARHSGSIIRFRGAFGPYSGGATDVWSLRASSAGFFGFYFEQRA